MVAIIIPGKHEPKITNSISHTICFYLGPFVLCLFHLSLFPRLTCLFLDNPAINSSWRRNQIHANNFRFAPYTDDEERESPNEFRLPLERLAVEL